MNDIFEGLEFEFWQDLKKIIECDKKATLYKEID